MTVVDSNVKSIELTDEEYHCLYQAEKILGEIFESFGYTAELVNVSCDERIQMVELPRIRTILHLLFTDYLWEVKEVELPTSWSRLA